MELKIESYQFSKKDVVQLYKNMTAYIVSY